MEEATISYYVFCIKVRIFPTLISIQVLLKAFNSLFAPKLLFIEVFGVSVQLYLDLDYILFKMSQFVAHETPLCVFLVCTTVVVSWVVVNLYLAMAGEWSSQF